MARHNHAKNSQHKAAPQAAETSKPEAVSAQPQAVSAKPEVVAQPETHSAQPEAHSAQPEAHSAQPETHPAHSPSESQIAQRAYELYLAQGGHHGRHEEHWLQAERELSLKR